MTLDEIPSTHCERCEQEKYPIPFKYEYHYNENYSGENWYGMVFWASCVAFLMTAVQQRSNLRPAPSHCSIIWACGQWQRVYTQNRHEWLSIENEKKKKKKKENILIVRINRWTNLFRVGSNYKKYSVCGLICVFTWGDVISLVWWFTLSLPHSKIRTVYYYSHRRYSGETIDFEKNWRERQKSPIQKIMIFWIGEYCVSREIFHQLGENS